MRPFLRGFADELIKIAGGDSWEPPRPPSTATGYEQAPKPLNASPANADVMRSIPKQRMEWSPSKKPDNWQPSPGFRLPTPKPAETPKPKVGVSKPKPSSAEPAWESAQQKLTRMRNERSYNAGAAANKITVDSTKEPVGAPPRAPGAAKNDAKGEFTPMSPERKAFFNGNAQIQKSTSVRKPGGLRGGPDLPADKNLDKVEKQRIDAEAATKKKKDAENLAQVQQRARWKR